jgi:hypothetical protein
MNTRHMAAGNYRYIPAVFQYSGGVVADPGHRLERVTFHRPLPLAEGFRAIAEIIGAAGRPLTAFAHCELRSPAPFTETGFTAFNEVYVGTLTEWGVFDPATRTNPVARSNVCPELASEKPAEPSFYAFSYTLPAADAAPSFCVAGSGEAPEGRGNYKDHIVRRGDLTADGLVDKARWVLGEMQRRLAALGQDWSGVTATQVYTVHDLYPFLADEIVARGAARHGLTWHHCRPPVVELEYEMDCRGLAVERIV